MTVLAVFVGAALHSIFLAMLALWLKISKTKRAIKYLEDLQKEAREKEVENDVAHGHGEIKDYRNKH